jgi:hypothetical protein
VSAFEQTVLGDREVLEVLSNHPDLLAIADAVAATQRRRRRRLPLARVGIVAAAVVTAAAVALVAPWQGRGAGFVARALAALGDGQVIHIVGASEVPGQTIIDLSSGAEQPVQAGTEIWFDGSRGFERTVTRIGGRIADEELQTPQGAWTQEGRVYTCAWIAAHPVEATAARVSCNPSGDNGTTPRNIPEPLPTLDPALSGFVSGYRDALANGTATREGSGVVEGRAVEWLRFVEQPQADGNSPEPVVERVAVDTHTLKPVLVDMLVGGKKVGETRIVSIETLAPQAVAYSKPSQASPAPVTASVSSQQTVMPAGAAAALGGTLVWAGASIDGLPLNQTTVDQIVSGYGVSSGLPDAHSTGVELVYGGPADWNAATEYVTVKESTQPQMLYGLAGPQRQPPVAGSMLVSSSEVMTAVPGTTQAMPTGKTLWYGILEQDGMYLSLEATNESLLLDSARALTDFQGSK